MNGGNRIDVLIVEDNPGDVVIIEEMLKDLKIDLNITLAEDGLEAVNLLKNTGSVMPDLMILDLNLPRMDGFDVLRMMKADDGLRSIPVVVMTGSLKKEDENKARSLGAADYCIKPATVEEMETTLMCLRGHLGPSWTKRNNDGPGSSASMSWDHLVSVSDGRLPPLCDQRFIMDDLDENWNGWDVAMHQMFRSWDSDVLSGPPT